MPINPASLGPTEAVILLNSTPVGEVVSERQLYRHRERAGLRITASGDIAKINLLKYVAWLVFERHRPRPEFDGLNSYEAQKQRALDRAIVLSRSSRDIGELPAVVKPERKAKAEKDFRYFCEQYFPKTFCLPWSDDHLKIVKLIEQVVLVGGQFAIALPRGGGKTVLCETASVWALLYGHRRFVAIVGPDEGHAMDRVKNLRTEFEHNDLLYEDFPEVCVPIRKLECVNQRRLLYRDVYVHLEFTAKRIILPSIPGSKAAGAIIETAGITGQIRGMNYKMRDGTSLRPSLCIVDDPQTRESAHSPSQCAQRERIINGDILGLAGPGASISVLLPCTVIQPEDLAERLLDREKNPQWHGQRTKMVYAWPKNDELWSRYAALRRDAQRTCGGNLVQIAEECKAFYAKHREQMDEGMAVAWSHRRKDDELSAVQHAWNLRIDLKDEAFMAEYQNEPLKSESDSLPALTADFIAGKTNGIKRGIVPLQAHHLVAFVDVHDALLYWTVAAFGDDFTGWVVDYGTYPDQKKRSFTLAKATQTMALRAPGAGKEGAIRAGLDALAARLLDREWHREDASGVRVERCLVDTGYVPDVVYDFVRHSAHASILLGSRGFGIGAKNRPITEYSRKAAERLGWNWIVAPTADRRTRYIRFDTNHWKSFLQARLAATHGDRASLSLFGRDPRDHDLFAQHLTGEYAVLVTANGRTVAEWSPSPQHENHWLDCVVGCCVAASLCGAKLEGASSQRVVRKRKSFAELQQQAQQRRAAMG
ncbi:MAG TPA: terminase gpA endonuclease subunit [Phycisphaerae bacterium]|nr:terminase gpA endonuclease subunit [Phycisphaerae bacterium]